MNGKRIVALALVGVLALSLFAGCTSKGKEEEQDQNYGEISDEEDMQQSWEE